MKANFEPDFDAIEYNSDFFSYSSTVDNHPDDSFRTDSLDSEYKPEDSSNIHDDLISDINQNILDTDILEDNIPSNKPDYSLLEPYSDGVFDLETIATNGTLAASEHSNNSLNANDLISSNNILSLTESASLNSNEIHDIKGTLFRRYRYRQFSPSTARNTLFSSAKRPNSSDWKSMIARMVEHSEVSKIIEKKCKTFIKFNLKSYVTDKLIPYSYIVKSINNILSKQPNGNATASALRKKWTFINEATAVND